MERKLAIPDSMYVELDPDTKVVLEFMQRNIACPKLVAVANAIKELATPLWGHYQKDMDEFRVISLQHHQTHS